jgi:hypothetical protein
MNNESLVQRAILLSNKNVFSLKEAIVYINNDLSKETLSALVNRPDFDWPVFFENINVNILTCIFDVYDDILLPRLSNADVMVLIECIKHKNLERLWRMILKKKGDIPYSESPYFVKSIYEWDEVKNGGVDIFKIFNEYYNNLNDPAVVVELVKQIKIKEVKEILLNCDGVLSYIANLKAKEAVEVGLTFDLSELWNGLLLRSDIFSYIRNDIEPEKVYQIVSYSEVFRAFSNRGNLEISALITYAKKTNFKAAWEYIVLNERNPKILLSLISDFPYDYLREDVFSKACIVSYIKDLRYGGIVSILAKTNNAKLFDFVLGNMTIKTSAKNLMGLAQRFSNNASVWNKLLNREDVLSYIKEQLKSGSEYAISLGDQYKSKVLWDYIVNVVDIDISILIAKKIDYESTWKLLFSRPEFPKDNVTILFSIYKSTNSVVIQNIVLSFDSVQKYIAKNK